MSILIIFLLILGVITLIFGLIPLWFSRRFAICTAKRLHGPIGNYAPRVSVMIPCKGVDLGFAENIAAVFEQDYPAYEVLFVTATEDDPAHVELNRIIEQHEGLTIRLMVAGIDPRRGQKITNLLKAVENVSKETEVFVFLDADIRIHKTFLRYLVAPLRNETVGATTGFPWYLPQKGNMGSILRSLWGAGALPLLVDPDRNFTSGAANAIKRTIFDTADIRTALDRSISDSFAITNSVRKLGLQIEFVPQCLVISPDNSTLLETLKWTNRQTIISRVYSPPFWWMVFITYSFSNTMLILGIFLLLLGVAGEYMFLLPSLLMLSIIPLEIISALILLPVIQQLIPEHKTQINQLKWRYFLFTPFASILIMVNSLVSLTTNEIVWRGVRYKLISPSETRVLD
jgi:ceramide glucosyltransferase